MADTGILKYYNIHTPLRYNTLNKFVLKEFTFRPEFSEINILYYSGILPEEESVQKEVCPSSDSCAGALAPDKQRKLDGWNTQKLLQYNMFWYTSLVVN